MAITILDGIGSGYEAKVDSNNRLFVDSLLDIGSPTPVRIYNSYKNGSPVGPMNLDDSTFAVGTISYEHHEIHAGEHYNIRGFNIIASSGTQVCWSVVTPNTNKWAHMKFEIEGTNQTEVYEYEGATLSGGTLITPINNNRNSSNTSDLIIRINPIISGTTPTSGLLLASHSKGLNGTTPSKADAVGETEREDELVLKSGTTYMWCIKSAGDNNIIDYSATWYEHTDKIKIF